ncbi:structural protein P5, partial [Parabacteroides merdae]|nr:structural protein P5 [Parabacteroides merdae]
MEEFIMTARGLRNNNPGNIRINGDLFQGEVRPSKDKSFKQFTTMAYGYRAMFKILS